MPSSVAEVEEREVAFLLSQRSVEHWVEALNAAGVPCGPVLDVAQVFSDPQVLARQMLVELPHSELGTFKTTGLPVKLSESAGAIRRAPPLHAEHTDEVLHEHGLDDEIRALRRRGAVNDESPHQRGAKRPIYTPECLTSEFEEPGRVPRAPLTL